VAVSDGEAAVSVLLLSKANNLSIIVATISDPAEALFAYSPSQ
tara:strand:+ start:379 stop:507 length:129 start_codon:yes stop_codon:yes gene_type:complete